MMSLRQGRSITGALLLLAGIVTAACAPAVVVVPHREGGYTERDTLRGRLKDKDIRVTFRHVTISRIDTIVQWRTVYRDGARVDTVRMIDTLRVGGGRRPGQRVDTVRITLRDTVRIVDTVRIGIGGRPPARRVDTVRVVVRDTIRIRDNSGAGGGGTGPIIGPGRPIDPRVDTVRIRIHDTVRVVVRDTIRRVDTVRVNVGGVDTVRIPGQRTLFVPPGQYPPTGECRVWIYDRPPGQQARAAACNALGPIPPGAFILFGGKAWDFDYDWLADPGRGSVPPEIIALTRRRGR
jgi:hypothetical protein